MRKYLFALTILFISANTHSQNLNRCYRQINAGEYITASNGLYKIIKKKSHPLAYYFFAQLLSRVNNSDRDLAFAYSSLRFIYPDSSNNTFSKKKKKKYAYQYGFSYSNMKILHDEICRQALDSCRNKKTVTEFGFYLATYTTSPFLKIATQERNALAWTFAQSASNAGAINDFIKLYPDAFQIADAEKLYDQLNYMESTVGKTAADYQQFLNNNPSSPYFKEAKEKYERLFFEEETKDQSVFSYYRFLIDHTENPYYTDAWNKLKTEDRDFLLSVLPDLTTYYNGKDIEPDLWKTLLHLKLSKIDSININWFHALYPNHPYHNYFDSLLNMLSIHLHPIEHNGFYGFTNDKGDTAIYPVYDIVNDFAEGYAAVALGLEDQDVFGFINSFGQPVISFNYDDAYSFKNGLALVGAKDSSGEMKYGFINPFEDFVIPMSFEDADTFSESVTLLQNSVGLYGF